MVIGETSGQLLDDDAALTPLGAVEVKGKVQPVTAYLVSDSAHPLPEDGQPGVPGATS